MGQVFDLKSGRLAVGDPTSGLALYQLSLPAGTYRLGPKSLRRVPGATAPEAQPFIDLDSPCVYALDATHVEAFEAWYHRVGSECSYMVHALAKRLAEFEAAAGTRVGFYWEQEIAGKGQEGRYVLDPARILKDT